MIYHADQTTLESFIQTLSKEVHQQFHSQYTNDTWHFESHNYFRQPERFYFKFGGGRKINDRYVQYDFYYNININPETSHLELMVADLREPKTMEPQKIYEFLSPLIKKLGFEGFFSFNCYQYQINELEVVGEKAENIYGLFDHFAIKDNYLTHIPYEMFRVSWDFEKEQILLTYNDKIIYSFKMSEEIETFKEEYQREKKIIAGHQQALIDQIKEIDSTCYYDAGKEYLHIFNDTVPFWLRKSIENGKVKYKARFNDSYYRNQNLEKLVKSLEERFQTLIKKKRIKAAVTGKSTNMVRKLLYELYNYHYEWYEFNTLFDSTLPEGELSIHLKENLDRLKKEALDPFYLEYYQTVLKSKKIRNKVKEGYHIADLYVFTSATKIFILKKEEFEAITLPENWRTKKDREYAKELEEKKQTLLTV